MTPQQTPSARREPLRVGMVAPKHTLVEQANMLSCFTGIQGEVFRENGEYDVVLFLNVTSEIMFLKKHTDVKTLIWAAEPKYMWPPNYDSSLLSVSDYYMGYRNFAGDGYEGHYESLVLPVCFQRVVDAEFPASVASHRDLDFCTFARHDPNIRSLIAEGIMRRGKAVASGHLFGSFVADKLSTQRRCRYEMITENDINEYYFSEKIGHALLAGCVPVYWGCTRASSVIPKEFFIDMHDFCGASGLPDIESVISYCLQDGVYERYFAAIRGGAAALLRDRLSAEPTFIRPIQAFLDALNDRNWHSRIRSCAWRWRSSLRTLRGIVPPLPMVRRFRSLAGAVYRRLRRSAIG